MRIISVCLVIFLVFLSILAPFTLASSQFNFPEAPGQINEALQKTVPVRFVPTSPFYYLITIKELVTRAFQPSSEKRAEFDFILSGKRLKEAYFLVEKGDTQDANKSLARYPKKLADVRKQFEKARSQNQDVTNVTNQIAEGLKSHETLLWAISQKTNGDAQTDANLKDAASGFVETVMLINNVMPGVKDRFKTVASTQEKTSPTPAPTVEPTVQATSSSRPRRIIY